MESRKYRIVFEGDIKEGSDIESVKVNMAIIYNQSIDKIDSVFFAGKRAVVKKNVSLEIARGIQKEFEKSGAICFIEEEENEFIPTSEGNDGFVESNAFDKETLKAFKSPEVRTTNSSSEPKNAKFSLSKSNKIFLIFSIAISTSISTLFVGGAYPLAFLINKIVVDIIVLILPSFLIGWITWHGFRKKKNAGQTALGLWIFVALISSIATTFDYIDAKAKHNKRTQENINKAISEFKSERNRIEKEWADSWGKVLSIALDFDRLRKNGRDELDFQKNILLNHMENSENYLVWNENFLPSLDSKLGKQLATSATQEMESAGYIENLAQQTSLLHEHIEYTRNHIRVNEFLDRTYNLWVIENNSIFFQNDGLVKIFNNYINILSQNETRINALAENLNEADKE